MYPIVFLRLNLEQTDLFFKTHAWESSETQRFLKQAEIIVITRNTNQSNLQ